MMEVNTNSADMKSGSKKCTTYAACFPSASEKLTKVGWCHRKLPNCRPDQTERMHWCGFRSLMSSLTSRLTAGIANRWVIPTSSSDVWAQTRLRSPSSTDAIDSTKVSSETDRNVVRCTSDVERSDVSALQCLAAKVAGSGQDEAMWNGIEGEAGGLRKIEEEECSGWWWWDGYDLTSVTPAPDMSTFWNEINSWLTTTALEDDNDSLQSEMKPPNIPDTSISSSSSSAKARRYACQGKPVDFSLSKMTCKLFGGVDFIR